MSRTNALALATVLFAPATFAAAQTTTFVATLDASQVVPPTAPTGAGGSGVFIFDAGTLTITYTISTSGLSGTGGTAANIRLGDWGSLGASIATLTGGPADYSGVTPALSPAQVTALFDNRLYCDVDTALNVSGEIRGQIIEQSVLNARRGNVDTVGGDPAAVVVTVGGSSGHPVYRALTRPVGPATIELARPPAGGSAHYAVWIFPGESTRATLTPCTIANGQGGTESIGMASYCLPANNTASPGSCPCPMGAFPVGFTSKRINGAGAAAAVCLHRSPADPLPPTAISVNFPVGKWTVVGVMFDPNARTTGPRLVSLTNTVLVVAQ
ncbi:MAG: CHRD domain-containing protein [Planctomycetes bacterium]|nr:CHRD domain-containing protein [Planctomycetota bacterium]MBI3846434.1 CHRD domain-containing protein [Planctomycetota bacterium]